MLQYIINLNPVFTFTLQTVHSGNIYVLRKILSDDPRGFDPDATDVVRYLASQPQAIRLILQLFTYAHAIGEGRDNSLEDYVYNEVSVAG